MSVTTKDLRSVLDIVDVAYAPGADLADGVLPAVARLVGGEPLTFNRIDHCSGRLLGAAAFPAGPQIDGLAGFHETLARHPAFDAYRVGHVRTGCSVALSDLADRATLGANPLFAEFYRPRGTRDQLINPVRITRQCATVLTVNRSRRGFSRRDRAVLDLLAPHLSRAFVMRGRLAQLTAAVREATRQTERLDRAGALLDRLTTRERQVVEHLVDGTTDWQIVAALGIGHRTVHKHLEQIYRKLNIGSRTSLIAAVQGHR